jgi:hypothetical protein
MLTDLLQRDVRKLHYNAPHANVTTLFVLVLLLILSCINSFRSQYTHLSNVKTETPWLYKGHSSGIMKAYRFFPYAHMYENFDFTFNSMRFSLFDNPDLIQSVDIHKLSMCGYNGYRISDCGLYPEVVDSLIKYFRNLDVTDSTMRSCQRYLSTVYNEDKYVYDTHIFDESVCYGYVEVRLRQVRMDASKGTVRQHIPK